MRVSLVSHFGGFLDEGVRNIGRCIAEKLEDIGIGVKKLNVSSLFEWREIRDSHPDVIHFVLTPTSSGLIIAKFISSLCSTARTVISAPHPAIPEWRLLRLFKPDLILVQSEESERLFKSIGFRTEFLPNGVDTDRFKPVDLETKKKLRDKYGIPQDRFVILHLASLKKERNLDIFKCLQKQEGNTVLIIGRENEKRDESVVKELKDAGCLVLIKHFSNIEEIYNLADCYLFPVIDKKACVETPLSVLEAMSCNLPVISTRFGALPRLFNEGGGFIFADKQEDFCRAIEIIKAGGIEIRTREKVLPYSWENLCKRLVEIYEELLY